MKCFTHPETDAVGMCKNCYKGLCSACAADVGDGLACRDMCEASVISLNRQIAQSSGIVPKTGQL